MEWAQFGATRRQTFDLDGVFFFISPELIQLNFLMFLITFELKIDFDRSLR